LQVSRAGTFAPGQLRTLQRRVKQWRTEIARQLVLGLESGSASGSEMYAAAFDSDEVRP